MLEDAEVKRQAIKPKDVQPGMVIKIDKNIGPALVLQVAYVQEGDPKLCWDIESAQYYDFLGITSYEVYLCSGYRVLLDEWPEWPDMRVSEDENLTFWLLEDHTYRYDI